MEIAKFRRSEPQNPQTNWQKIGVGDYVGDDSRHVKTQNERPIEDMAAYA